MFGYLSGLSSWLQAHAYFTQINSKHLLSSVAFRLGRAIEIDPFASLQKIWMQSAFSNYILSSSIVNILYLALLRIFVRCRDAAEILYNLIFIWARQCLGNWSNLTKNNGSASATRSNLPRNNGSASATWSNLPKNNHEYTRLNAIRSLTI